MKYRMPKMAKRHNDEMAAEEKLAEVIYNIDSVKYFQQEERESQNIQNKTKQVRDSDLEVIKSLALLNTIQNIIISVGMAGGLTMSIFDCYAGKISAGDILMLQAIFAQIVQPLFFFGILMKGVAETKMKLQFAIESIKEANSVKYQKIDYTPFTNAGSEIKFENVWFSYNNESPLKQNVKNGLLSSEIQNTPETPKTQNHSINHTQNNNNHQHQHFILKNLSLEVKKKEFTAIVGKSGQGKSTIFNLIVRKLYY